MAADEQAAERLEKLRARIEKLEQKTFAQAIGAMWMFDVSHALTQHTQQLAVIEHQLTDIGGMLDEQRQLLSRIGRANWPTAPEKN